MTDARFGDVVWVKPQDGMRCILPPSAVRRKTLVPPAGMEVIVDLMILKLIGHGDLVVMDAPEAAVTKVGE